MTDLVINLGAVNDGLVEGNEQYQVVLSNPGTTTVSDITLDPELSHHDHHRQRHADHLAH